MKNLLESKNNIFLQSYNPQEYNDYLIHLDYQIPDLQYNEFKYSTYNIYDIESKLFLEDYEELVLYINEINDNIDFQNNDKSVKYLLNQLSNNLEKNLINLNYNYLTGNFIALLACKYLIESKDNNITNTITTFHTDFSNINILKGFKNGIEYRFKINDKWLFYGCDNKIIPSLKNNYINGINLLDQFNLLEINSVKSIKNQIYSELNGKIDILISCIDAADCNILNLLANVILSHGFITKKGFAFISIINYWNNIIIMTQIIILLKHIYEKVILFKSPWSDQLFLILAIPIKNKIKINHLYNMYEELSNNKNIYDIEIYKDYNYSIMTKNIIKKYHQLLKSDNYHNIDAEKYTQYWIDQMGI